MAERAHQQVQTESWEALQEFGTRYRADAAVRARVAGGDYSDLELQLPRGMELRVMEQTADTFYFPLPPDPNSVLADETLLGMSGGSYTAGSMATLGMPF